VPEPYYKHDGIEIYVGDARELLPCLPAGLTVTDPPYNVGYGYDEYTDRMPDHEYQEMMRITAPSPAVVIHYPEALFEMAIARGAAPSEMVAWVYNANTHRQWRGIAWWGITPDFSLAGQEYKNPTDRRVQQLIADGKQARLYDWWHIEQVKNISSEKTAHPCQIPVAVMERVFSITPFYGVIIDPFMGSGTTLRAAKNLGREAIGIEVSKAYADIAIDRLQQSVLAL